ncbi:Protein of unknown function DUF3716 [Penicillium angulare]|uniref:Protein of unknown function DUF3716 n=1 Tax=Penicillium angulare TaxID=116970 RepID=UPI00254036E5|nr:Protein of unknown function DUF3716 [Penicillium angulare]KAJ5266847.1 Protein of unknown function DUF3716 [Penicillium angulare]
MPQQREPLIQEQFIRNKKNWNGVWFISQVGRKIYRVEALLIIIVGEVQTEECSLCQSGIGPFPHCIKLPGPNAFISACVNCHYVQLDYNCSDITGSTNLYSSSVRHLPSNRQSRPRNRIGITRVQTLSLELTIQQRAHADLLTRIDLAIAYFENHVGTKMEAGNNNVRRARNYAGKGYPRSLIAETTQAARDSLNDAATNHTIGIGKLKDIREQLATLCDRDDKLQGHLRESL